MDASDLEGAKFNLCSFMLINECWHQKISYLTHVVFRYY